MAFAVIMVRAVHIGIKRQRTVQERLHCLIGIALHTADQTDIGLRKRCRAPPPMPPQISVSTPSCASRPASAP